jgi:hypothetical protein
MIARALTMGRHATGEPRAAADKPGHGGRVGDQRVGAERRSAAR